MKISPPSTAIWHVLTGIAHLAREQSPDLPTFAQRCADLLKQSGMFAQGAILRLGQQRSLLTAWGMNKRATNRLLPARVLNGGSEVRLPDGWQMFEIGTAEVPGVLVAPVTIEPEPLTVLVAQLTSLWQGVALQEEFARRERTVAAMTESLQGLAQQLNADDFLQTLVTQATELLGAAGGGVYMTDSNQQYLELRQVVQFPANWNGARIQVGKGVAGKVAQSGKPMLVNDYAQAKEKYDNLPEGINFTAVMAAPLRADEAIIGVLVLVHIEPDRGFQNADLALLESFAAQASLAMRTAKLFDAQRQRSRELYLLYENSLTVGSSLDLSHILNRLTENVLLALGVEQCLLLLWDDRRKLCELVAQATDDDAANSLDLSIGATYELRPESILKLSFDTQQPVVVVDIDADPRINAQRSWLKARGIRSALGLPMLLKERVIGTLLCTTTSKTRTFNPGEITLAQTLAAQAATAIGNTRLLNDERRRNAELSVLQSLSAKLTSGVSLQVALESIGESVVQLFDNIDLEICLYDPQNQVLNSQFATPRTRQHYASEGGSYGIDQGLTGWLARHRSTLRIDDLQRQKIVKPIRPHETESGLAFRSFLGVPMLIGDQLIGTLELGSSTVGRFDAEDERLLNIISSQAAQALRNVQRYEATDEVLRERVRELLALQRISRELTSTLQLEQLLPAMLTEITQATGCGYGIVVLHNEDESLQVIAQTGYNSAEAAGVLALPLLNNGLLSAPMQRAEALIYDDVTVLEANIAWGEIRSLLMAPILYENRVAGAIIAGDVKGYSFDHAALDFVRAVADQAALAIGNAQHYEEQVKQRELLQQRASLLNEVLEIGNALRADMELSNLLEQIAFSVTEAAGYRMVLFNLIDPARPTIMRTAAGAGIALSDLEQLRSEDISIETVHPLLDPQYRIGRAYYITRGSDSNAWHDGDQLLVPLYSTERELIGIMTVDDPFTHEAPTRRTVETLEIFANQAAIAIENAWLFDQRSRQIAELAIINRISRAATASLEFNDLAREVYNVLRENLPIRAYYLAVFDTQRNSVVKSLAIDDEHFMPDVVNGPINESSLMARIIKQRKTLYFNDMTTEFHYDEDNSPPRNDEGNSTDVPRSWIGVPLLLGDGTVRGVLSLQHNEAGRYGERDAAVLDTIANQLAVAIENSRLYTDTQSRLNELALINKIGSLTNSTLDFVEILKGVYESLRTTLELNVFYSFVYDPTHGEIVLRVNVEEGKFFIEEQREKLLPNSPSAHVVNALEPLVFRDMPQEIEGKYTIKRFGNPDKWVRSWVGVPLKIRDDTAVGMLSVQHYEPNIYSEREAELLQTIASQVALAVQNARLFGDRERQIRELDAISQIGQLMSASLDLSEMLGLTAEYLQEVTSAPVFYTMIYDAEHDQITDGYAVQEGVPAERTPRGKPRPGSPSAWVVQNRAPLILADVTNKAELQQKGVQPMSNPIEGKNKSPRSWIGVPIIARDGAPIGMLSLQDYRTNAFDQRTVAFLTNVVSHISLGVQKVQLFNERDRQIKELDVIRRVGQVTSSTLNADELMQGVYNVLREFLPIEIFNLSVFDSDLTVRSHSFVIDRGLIIQYPKATPITPHSLTAWILEHRQPLLFKHVDEEMKAYPDIHPRVQSADTVLSQSLMGVPLLTSNDEPLGILLLQHYKQAMFDERDLQLLINVAYQVTLGMQNVLLYSQTQDGLEQLATEAERLALINHVSDLTASTLDTQVLYDLAVEEMAQVTDASQARLVIFDYEAQVGYTRAEFPKGDLSIEVPVANNGTIPWMQRHRRPLVINNPLEHELTESFRETISKLGIQALMLVPLIVKGEVVGSIGLDHIGESRHFSQRDAETCQTIANQISQGLENARLFAETERQAHVLSRKVGELSVLLEAGQALSSIHEPTQVLDTLVRLVARQLNIETVILFTGDEELQPVASLGLPTDFVQSLRVKRGEGLVGTVAEQRKPLTTSASDGESPIISQHVEFNRDHGLSVFMGVPIVYRNELLGVLSVMSGAGASFSEDDTALLSALADQAAIAIENTRLFVERERQITVLQALNDVTQAITSTLDPQTLLRQLHLRLSSVVDTRYSFIVLYDSDHNVLTFPVVMNAGREERLEPQALAEGVLSRVIRGRRTIVLNTIEETANASRFLLGHDTPMASWVGIPIMLGDMVLGVITIQSPNPRAFSTETIQFLQAVASQTAIALENARLFADRERQVTEAAILSSISQSMTATLSPEELASSILKGLTEIYNTDNAYIVFYDAPTNMISTTVGFSNGQPYSLISHVLSNNFLKTMLFEQRPLMFNSSSDLLSERFSPRLEGIPDAIEPESVIAASITMGSQTYGMNINQPLGVLVIQSPTANTFSRAQLQFLESLANQSSAAVQKAMLFTERERRIRELDTLNRISQGITSTISLDEILERLYAGLGEIVDVSTAFIGLYDPQTHSMEFREAHDRGAPVTIGSRRLSVGVPAWVIEHRQPLLLNTSEEANEYRDAQTQITSETSAMRVGGQGEIEQSYLVVPIVVGVDVIGIINIQSYEEYSFSEYDMSFVTTVAAQAGAAIANARLFSEREQSIQRLNTLNNIGQALSSTVRFDDLLRVIYEQTGKLVKTENFYLALYDERNKEVTFPLYYEYGHPINVMPQRGVNGLTEYVIRKRQPLLLQGPHIAERMTEMKVDQVGDMARSWLGIPLIAADKVVGVMTVQSYEQDNAYSDELVQLLLTIASQAAQALENARLFSESRQSVRELSTLSETSVSLASTLEIDELMAISASSAIEMSRADFGGIIVVAGDGYTITNSLALNRDHMELELPDTNELDVGSMEILRPLRSGHPLALFDASTDEGLAPFVNSIGMRGSIFLPMLREGLRGVVFVGMDEPFTFNERTISSLMILATQIGQAINNAQLFDQIRRFNLELEEIVDQRTLELKGEKERVEALYNIATELGTTLDRDELLLRTLDLAASALMVRRGAVFLLDRESKDLVCHAVLNEELGLKSIETRVRFQHPGLANWIIEHNEGVVISDVWLDERWTNAQSGRGDDVRSVIAVPLLSSDAPQGVLMLYSNEIGFFTQDHLRFLSTIGGEVSSALHNADLYTLVYDSADRLSDAMWQQREEASKTAAILQSVSEGVMVLDHQTEKIILYNPAAEDVLRIPRSEVMHNSLQVVAAPRNEEELHEEGRSLLLYAGLHEGIQVVQRSEGVHRSMIELPGQSIAANFAPVVGEESSRFGVVVVLRDITREVEADRAKRDFVATVSHELRTPLTPIRGFVDLLLLGAVGQLSDPQREMLNTVKTNAMRMVGLVEDLLEIGRLEAGKIVLNTAPNQINQLVRDIVATWGLEIEKKNMTLKLELDDTLPLIEYDSKRIGQVLTNMVSNAIKYTYAGGDVIIRTFINEEKMIQLDVKDTGVGLTAEQQKSMFKRFYRADSPLRDEVGGTGLGLSIAKSFIELHNGDMWVQSIYGEGSTFSFSLPEVQPRPDLGERDEV